MEMKYRKGDEVRFRTPRDRRRRATGMVFSRRTTNGVTVYTIDIGTGQIEIPATDVTGLA